MPIHGTERNHRREGTQARLEPKCLRTARPSWRYEAQVLGMPAAWHGTPAGAATVQTRVKLVLGLVNERREDSSAEVKCEARNPGVLREHLAKGRLSGVQVPSDDRQVVGISPE
jgi:hypothetical protein